MRKFITTSVLCCLLYLSGYAQEMVLPLLYNPHQNSLQAPVKFKTTTLSLPFFEDFAQNSPIPDNSRWIDRSVYINNTMAVNPVSRGVATFDALDYRGLPYDSTNPFLLLYADSLTSQPIDLSVYSPADSIYLSFFYQPQGRGFAPETQDSLMLYLKDTADAWIKVWAKEGTSIDSFRQVMIPITDPAFFHGAFQFRFVNIASINLNDDIWNLDYIRLAANRNMYDTAVNDVSTLNQPTSLLNDYTSMPYRQFMANVSGEQSAQHSFTVRNYDGVQRSVVYGYTAREQASNTFLSSSPVSNDNLDPYSYKSYSFGNYSPGFTAPSPYARVVFENKYFVSDPGGTDPKANDTIIYEQVFDNYLAYDDGTAEKSYFLKQGNTLPAKTAIEFHLNQPDTLRGVAIYFGRQVPLALLKFFDIAVYKHITVGSFFDTAIYLQSLNFPGYVDTINHFWVYRFDTAVALPAGTFFLGTIQPAQSGSDSLYFGLDLNRQGGNHLYVNDAGTWQPSIVQGALMIRPLLGQPVIGTNVDEPASNKTLTWNVFPNPAENQMTVTVEGHTSAEFELLDMQGRTLQRSGFVSHRALDISALSPGIYFVRIFADGQVSPPRKIVKL